MNTYVVQSVGTMTNDSQTMRLSDTGNKNPMFLRPPTPQWVKRWFASWCLLAAVIPVSAQIQPLQGEKKEKPVPVQVRPAPDTDNETVVELSPFEVRSDTDVGYMANNTLAGTLLQTKLVDIANSVQVLTKDFLDDVGATNLSQLLIYTTSTETTGPGGNASFSEVGNRLASAGTERSQREPQLNQRVRGMAAADLTRDYFLSDIGFDAYNTSEITINRGPNASLFGLGSPGGIMNSAIDKAQTDRTFGQVNVKGDQNGDLRSSLNYNQVILKNKLAVRVATLHWDRKFKQEHAYYDERRYFAAATWRPIRNLTVRANYETGGGRGSLPIDRPPTDKISAWFANGKPAYNPLTQQWFINGALVTNPAQITALNSASIIYAGVAGPAPIAIFDDPNSPNLGNNGYGAITTGIPANAAGRTATTLPVTSAVGLKMWNGIEDMYPLNATYIVGANPNVTTATNPYYYNSQVLDTSIFDGQKYSLGGPTNQTKQDFQIFNFAADKTWFDNNLGVSAGYQKQHWLAELYVTDDKALEVDINTVLLDGSPNPNFGRPFAGGRGYYQERIRDRDGKRVIGFANYDFDKNHSNWLRHLGRHVLTAVVSQQIDDETQPKHMAVRASNDYNAAVATGGANLAQAYAYATSPVAQGLTRASVVQYLGPTMANLSSPQGASIQGVSVAQIPQATNNALIWNPFTSRFEKGAVDFYNSLNDYEETWLYGNPRNKGDIKSFSSVLQSYFLNDHLVTTVSWRTDHVKSYVGNQATDPATGLTLTGEVPLGEPFFDQSVSQSSYGVVGHVPDKWLPKGTGLSAHFVDSKNIAAGSAGVDIFNRPAKLQSGSTKEYGVSVSAFGGKLFGRANFFNSAQKNQALTGTLPQIGNPIVLVMQYNTPAQLAAAGWNLNDGSLFDPGTIKALNIRPLNPNVPNNQTTWLADNIAGTATHYFQDTSTEGMELELTYAPTSSWRIALNVSNAEAEISNVMPIAAPELTRIANKILSDPLLSNLLITSNPVFNPDGTYTAASTMRNQMISLLSAIAAKKAPEGGPLQELRNWRWNLLTNYRFAGGIWEDTWLSPFGVGAGVRWQEKVAIGSDLKVVDGATVPDYSKMYYGPSETDVDTWLTYSTKIGKDMGLQLQLRVRNIDSGSDGDLIPVKANPDGHVALWRYGLPRTYELSARLDF